MGPITIVPIPNTKSEIKKFVTCAWRFYRGNPCWVPPLISDQVNLILSGPYHEVGVIQPFLAYRDGEIVGRIIAHYDNRHNEYFKEKRGCVGFFESDNDTGVSRALFGAAGATVGVNTITPQSRETTIKKRICTVNSYRGAMWNQM